MSLYELLFSRKSEIIFSQYYEISSIERLYTYTEDKQHINISKKPLMTRFYYRDANRHDADLAASDMIITRRESALRRAGRAMRKGQLDLN